MITDIAGIRVGHWTDAVARTGCTVIRFPEGTVASAEVRGGAPATRELDLLAPHRKVNRLDAVVLSGGSAFGLAAADGVMSVLEGEGIGFPTPAGVVPIVIGLALYDLGEGDPAVRPGAEQGRAACVAATAGPFEIGPVGAATGATVGAWKGPEARRRGGLGVATVVDADLIVSALVAVNPAGSIDDGTASAGDVDLSALRATGAAGAAMTTGAGNTVIGVVATNARLDKVGCLLVAQGGHDGLARAIFPPHTSADGDALVAAATGPVEAPADLVRTLALIAVERAIRSVTATA